MPRWFALPQHGMKAGDGSQCRLRQEWQLQRSLAWATWTVDGELWSLFVVSSVARPFQMKQAQSGGGGLFHKKSCASISAKHVVQDRRTNLTTSVRNVVQSDTGRSNVGRVENTNGPTHNKGTGCGKGQWCVANISHQSIFKHYFRCWKFI